MAWSWGKKDSERGKPWSFEQPDRKKRKVDKNTKEEEGEQDNDDWDDNVEFTQAELETLDVMASQAINQEIHQSNVIQAQSSVHVQEQPTETPFVMPAYPVLPTVHQSTSSSSSSSHQPPSLTSRSSSDTHGSLSSHSFSNGKMDSPREMVQILQTKLDKEIKTAQEDRYRFNGEIRYLRESVHKQEEELEKLRATRDELFDQQKEAQAEKIQKLQAHLDSLISEAQFKAREFQALQEQNQALQQKVKKLEQQQGGDKMDVQLSQSPRQASPRKVPVQPSPPSKHKLQKQTEESSSKQSLKFPTAMLFMERVPTPPSLSAADQTRPDMPSVSCQTTGMVSTNKLPQRRRLQLNVGQSKVSGNITGQQVVRHLLQLSSNDTCKSNEKVERNQWDPGLVGLLHAMSTSLRIAGLTYMQGKDSSLVPLKPKRSKHLLKSPSSDQGDRAVQIVSRENYQLAITGLIQLLDESSKPEADGQDTLLGLVQSITDHLTELSRTDLTLCRSTENHPDKEPPLRDQRVELTAPTSADTMRSLSDGQYSITGHAQTHAPLTLDQGPYSGAIFLLPLLTDYIEHYVDMLNSSVLQRNSAFPHPQGGFQSPSSANSSLSSCDCSLDSHSSSILHLLNEGKIFAYNVEGCAVSALRCLLILIQLCPVVGRAIINSYISNTVANVVNTSSTTTTASSSSTVEPTGDPSSKKRISGGEADDEHSTSSSEIRIITGMDDPFLMPYRSPRARLRVSSTLLHLVMRLAGQDLQQDSQSNREVVQLALSVLTQLCQCCTREHMHKLEIIITRGLLSICFKQTQHLPVLLGAQKLLLSLSRCEKFLKRLCSSSENCPFYLMHRVCSSQVSEVADFYSEYIVTVSSIIAEHRAGLYQLLSNSCPCRDEFVIAVIMALHKLFAMYKKAEVQFKPSLLDTLAQGIILIHALAQGDTLFVQHYLPVQFHYVRLLSGLVAIMRCQHQRWEQHLAALDELYDFEPDTSDLSQDSESEDKMDQT